MCSIEGGAERPEVSEGAPALPDEGPVEQFEAVGLRDQLQAGEWRVGARIDHRVAAAGFATSRSGNLAAMLARVGSASVMAASVPVTDAWHECAHDTSRPDGVTGACCDSAESILRMG